VKNCKERLYGQPPKLGERKLRFERVEKKTTRLGAWKETEFSWSPQICQHYL